MKKCCTYTQEDLPVESNEVAKIDRINTEVTLITTANFLKALDA